MRDQTNPDLVLKPISLELLNAAQEIIHHWAPEVGYANAFDSALKYYPEYIRVVMGGDKIWAVYYPDSYNLQEGETVEIHCVMHRRAWHLPLEKQVQTLTEYAGVFFKNDSFARIELQCCEKYKLSHKIVLASGFQMEGRRRRAWYENGKVFDVLLFGLLKDEWKAA